MGFIGPHGLAQLHYRQCQLCPSALARMPACRCSAHAACTATHTSTLVQASHSPVRYSTSAVSRTSAGEMAAPLPGPMMMVPLGSTTI